MQCATITKTNQLMLCRETLLFVMAVVQNTQLCGQNVEPFAIKPGGT
jgi:hypothetical protein